MVILCHYTLSLQLLSPPPSEVCSDVFMCTEYIKKKKFHPLQYRLFALPCVRLATFFGVIWLSRLWEAQLINVGSHETQFFCPFNLFAGHVAHLSQAFSSLDICNLSFSVIASTAVERYALIICHLIQSHTSFMASSWTS